MSSILQRTALTPDELYSLTDPGRCIRVFGERYSTLDKPVARTFTRQEFAQRLRDPLVQLEPSVLLHAAA